MNTFCPNCGQETGGSRFCPNCGVQVSQQAAPYVPATPQPSKHTALWILVALLALLIVAAAIVVPLLLLRGEETKVNITSPVQSQKISSAELEVSVDVTNQGGVGWVAIYVDGVIQDSIKEFPFEASIPAGEPGMHGLKATAYDGNGKMLAEDKTSYWKVAGKTDNGQDGTDQTTEQYKQAVAAQVSEANILDTRVRNAANQINSELSKKYVSVSLVSDVQALYNRTVSLVSTVQGLRPPADMVDIQAQFVQLCRYLQTRADALVKGATAFNSGGDYMTEFDKGADAKSTFEKNWPVFLNTCRARGITV